MVVAFRAVRCRSWKGVMMELATSARKRHARALRILLRFAWVRTVRSHALAKVLEIEEQRWERIQERRWK